MSAGIAPPTLAEQVRNTAAWTLDLPIAPCAWLAEGAALTEASDSLPYFRLLLAAHFLTVATFCPTDVDARIRHHYWVGLDAREALADAVAAVGEVARVDPRPVSARVVFDDGTLCGHDGEWFAVRAGALARAVTLGCPDIAAELEAEIETELAREAAIFTRAVASRDVARALSAATILAHNTGDLSRVVELWPKHADLEPIRARLVKLGHEPDRRRFDGAFFVAGAVNKQVMAIENHRFLALRKARGLRRGRELLLPIGPFFDEWGRTIARSPLLEEEDRVEVVDALLETHLRGLDQWGALRALSAIADAGGGPWDRIVKALPARLRKVATQGPVAAALKLTERAFMARIENRFHAALTEAKRSL